MAECTCRVEESTFVHDSECPVHGWMTHEKPSQPTRTKHNEINHPAHYGGDETYEAIKVIEAWQLNFHLGNCVKYIARAGKKPGVPAETDLKKAAWYLNRQIKALEKYKEEFLKAQ